MARLRWLENARTGSEGTQCLGTRPIFFYDANAYIYSSTTTQLDLVAATVAITGNLTVSGTTSFDAIHVAFNQALLEDFSVGESGTGYDVKFWGDTASKYWLWDADTNKVDMVGAFDVEGNVAIDGTTTISSTLGVSGTTTLVAANLSGALSVATTTGLIGALTITPAASGTFVNFVLTNWGYGAPLINAAFGSAETLTNDTIGMLFDFATNVTLTTDKDLTGYQLKLPAFTQSAANTTNIIGFDLNAAGNLVQDSAAGTLNWKGYSVQMPLTNASTGTINAYGVYITSGTLTTASQYAIYIAGASTLTDGIKITSAAVDDIELSGACTNYININNVGTNAAIGIEFKDGFLGHSISTGSRSDLADGGVTLTSTNTFNAGFFADDSGANIPKSVSNVLARTLLTTTQSAGTIRSLTGQLKILTDIDVGTGVYTAVQGYIELVGNTDVATGGKASCFDASLEIADGATFTVDSGAIFAGVKIEVTVDGTGTFTQDGTVAALYIDKAGTVGDWKVGVDINDCLTGIDIGVCDTANIAISGANAIGINLTGTYSANGIVITTIPAAAMNGVFSDLTASTSWTSGNIVGVRGKVTITASSLSSATAVWAGVAITGAAAGNGLICAINAEVSSTKNTCPNAILYLQSLPAASDANFANVPYITFSETVTSGTGSNILFELGSVAADTTTTVTTGTLFYHDTIQIAVNKTAGTRTAYYIPLSTAEATFTFAYPVALGNTLTVGVDGTGHDVKFYGDTTGTYMLWDQDADKLVINIVDRAAALSAITATATLDGATNTYYGFQSNITKSGTDTIGDCNAVTAYVLQTTGNFTATGKFAPLQVLISGDGTVGTITKSGTGSVHAAWIANRGTQTNTDSVLCVHNQSAATATSAIQIENLGSMTNIFEIDAGATTYFADFDSVEGCVVTQAGGTITVTEKLKVLVGSNVRYIPIGTIA